MKLVNPTGQPIRGVDDYGSGAFGADRDNGSRKHLGLDIMASARQWIVSPIYGMVTRECHPYGDGKPGDCGIVIAGSGEHSELLVKLFYLDPFPGVIMRMVKPREIVGWATGLQLRYPGITDHVHLEVWKEGQRIDPEPLIEWALQLGEGQNSDA